MSGAALLAALLTSAVPARTTPPLVAFPGPQRSAQSPNSPARVFYVEMGADEGGQNLSLRFDSGRGRPILLKRFDRSVDIGWSPSGQRFLVNDYIGSDIADCLIVRPIDGEVRGISLIRIVARSRGRPRETPEDAHYYVHCSNWLSDNIVGGVVGGHTDEAHTRPMHPYSFEHQFQYDTATGRLTWLSHRTWNSNR